MNLKTLKRYWMMLRLISIGGGVLKSLVPEEETLF